MTMGNIFASFIVIWFTTPCDYGKESDEKWYFIKDKTPFFVLFYLSVTMVKMNKQVVYQYIPKKFKWEESQTKTDLTL